MTTPHRTLQMALDALDAITDDVDGTGLNTMPSFDKALDAIAALRSALEAPEPEPVALESVHLTRDTRGMCTVRVNGRVAIRDNGDAIDHMATLEWFAAPPAPAAPARVPLSLEHHLALREAHCNTASDEYFGARRGLDGEVSRRVYEAGFREGWESAHKIGGSK